VNIGDGLKHLRSAEEILVMDDEEVALQVVEATLENLGYQVERAVNGEETQAKNRCKAIGQAL